MQLLGYYGSHVAGRGVDLTMRGQPYGHSICRPELKSDRPGCRLRRGFAANVPPTYACSFVFCRIRLSCPFFDVLFQDNNEASLATQFIAADNHDEVIQVA